MDLVGEMNAVKELHMTEMMNLKNKHEEERKFSFIRSLFNGEPVPKKY